MKYCRETSSWSKSKCTSLLLTMSAERKKPVTVKAPLAEPLPSLLLKPGLPALCSLPRDRPTGLWRKAPIYRNQSPSRKMQVPALE